MRCVDMASISRAAPLAQASSSSRQQPCFLGTTQRQQQLHAPLRATSDDAAPLGDWRSFRAKLIAQDATEQQSTRRVCEQNLELMKEQTPKLASEEHWVHATPVPERGGLLLATPRLPVALGDERLWQSVVLLIQHDAEGSVGFLLNRPTGIVMSSRLGGRPMEGSPNGVREVFAENRLYCGGFTAQQVVHLLHGVPGLSGTVEVVPGVYLGGSSMAVQEVLEGRARPAEFRFLAGCCQWEPGELMREIRAGAWYTAACSRSVALKQCLQLPVPLWREVLELMGGEYLAVAQEAYEGDE